MAVYIMLKKHMERSDSNLGRFLDVALQCGAWAVYPRLEGLPQIPWWLCCGLLLLEIIETIFFGFEECHNLVAAVPQEAKDKYLKLQQGSVPAIAALP